MVHALCDTNGTNFSVHEADAHCVFRRANSWFALPALSVREVLFRPEIVAVPDSSKRVTGLCHLRSEFLAVVNLNGFLTEDAAEVCSEGQMIVVNGPEGPWALLVDEVKALLVLETTAVSDGHAPNNASEVVVARAVQGSDIVHVLDPDRLYFTSVGDRSGGE